MQPQLARRRERDLGRLSPELKFAFGAAAALLLSLFLPWYEKSFFAMTTGSRPVAVSQNLNAFQVFTFVEAGVLLVTFAVLYLIWARAKQHRFELPGGDGFAILLAGGWGLLLLVWRLFDKPHVNDAAATVGIQWGILVALLSTLALIAAGARLRTSHK